MAHGPCHCADTSCYSDMNSHDTLCHSDASLIFLKLYVFSPGCWPIVHECVIIKCVSWKLDTNMISNEGVWDILPMILVFLLVPSLFK